MPRSWRKLINCFYQRHHTQRDTSIVSCARTQNFQLSAFELLPDEILLDIFQYITVIDLFNGFVNLNSRLNCTLHDVRIAVHIRSTEDRNKNLEMALRYFASQIIYIYVYRYPSLDLRHFPHLRSLIIHLPTADQLASICAPFMSRLTRLRLGTIKQHYQPLVFASLFSKRQFTMLRFCNFFELDSDNIFASSKPCLTIRTLMITHCKVNDFIKLLPLLPNLHRFQVFISTVLPSTFNNPIAYHHEKLVDLDIHLPRSISQLALIDHFLSFVPNVQRCTVHLYNLETFAEYTYLQYILTYRLNRLRHLNCLIYYSCSKANNSLMETDFDRLRVSLPFFESMHVIECTSHFYDGCVDYISMNKDL